MYSNLAYVTFIFYLYSFFFHSPRWSFVLQTAISGKYKKVTTLFLFCFVLFCFFLLYQVPSLLNQPIFLVVCFTNNRRKLSSVCLEIYFIPCAITKFFGHESRMTRDKCTGESVRVKSVRTKRDINGRRHDSLMKSNWPILVDFNGTLISFGVSGPWIQKFAHLK